VKNSRERRAKSRYAVVTLLRLEDRFMSARVAISLAIVTATMLGTPRASAQSFDGYFSGRLMCDPIPSKSIGALNIAFNLTVTRGNATYRRAIYTPDGKMFLTNETGEGKVADDGTIALSGRAEFSSWHYQASYGGKKLWRKDGRQCPGAYRRPALGIRRCVALRPSMQGDGSAVMTCR
jgi:hypothetical protein